MRFVTFEHEGRVRAGVLYAPAAAEPAQQVVQVIDGAHPQRPTPLQSLEPDMMTWIEAGLVALSQAIKGESPSSACLIPLASVRLLAPLPRPGKVVGAAFNYRDGLAVSNRPPSQEPVLFVKSRSTVIGPEVAIELAAGHDVTYEAELAAVIGTTVLRARADDAMAHVCGYTIFNDVSYTNLVREDGAFVRGKNQPTTGPLGPWIVSADDVADPHALDIALDVDGVELQSSSTEQMLFRLPELIASASAGMPLDPGDIIATGTPAGVAANHNPTAWLKGGQRVTVRIAGLGELSNPVVEATS